MYCQQETACGHLATTQGGHGGVVREALLHQRHDVAQSDQTAMEDLGSAFESFCKSLYLCCKYFFDIKVHFALVKQQKYGNNFHFNNTKYLLYVALFTLTLA